MKDEVPITIISGDTIIKAIEERKEEINGKWIIYMRIPKGIIGSKSLTKPAIDKVYYRRFNLIRPDGSVSKNEQAIAIDTEKGPCFLIDGEYENLKQINDELQRQLTNLSNAQIKGTIIENIAGSRDKTELESEKLADYNKRMREKYFIAIKDKD